MLAVCLVTLSLFRPEAASRQAASNSLSKDRLIAAARAGGDYLLRMQRQDGSFYYTYDPQQDRRNSRAYNIVRHAGVAFSLFELYRATRDPRYLEASRRAVSYLKTRFRPAREPGAAYVLDNDGKAKLGANGLALLALTRQMELDPQAGDRHNARRLANLILVMQRKDGAFDSYYRIRGDEPAGSVSLYYPGEAILGLVSLYKVARDRRLLDAARRGADYLIESQRKLERLPPDAWLMQALEALHRIGRERRYADHALALAVRMMRDQYGDNAPAGYVGGFGPGIPRATPAAARAEGLVAAYRIARSMGDSTSVKGAMNIADALKAAARFQMAQQFDAGNSVSLPNPQRAMGGFRAGLTSMTIRIDYVQHNISALLGVAAIL